MLSIKLVGSSGNDALDQAVLQTVRDRYRFDNVGRNGATIPVTVNMTIEGSRRNQEARRRGERTQVKAPDSTPAAEAPSRTPEAAANSTQERSPQPDRTPDAEQESTPAAQVAPAESPTPMAEPEAVTTPESEPERETPEQSQPDPAPVQRSEPEPARDATPTPAQRPEPEPDREPVCPTPAAERTPSRPESAPESRPEPRPERRPELSLWSWRSPKSASRVSKSTCGKTVIGVLIQLR